MSVIDFLQQKMMLYKKTFPNKETFTPNYSITDEETQLSLMKKKVYKVKSLLTAQSFQENLSL